MPAVTVDDLTALPRIARPGPGVRPRPVAGVTGAPSGFEGEGFPVRRAFAGIDMADLDPFIHMDQMGEVEYAPGEPKGTAWHPHRGFETVTYMLDGTFRHQDSTGGGGLITNGDTQWMTAGAGILHIEAPPEELVASGGLFHGIQLWVNLPSKLKFTPPSYQDIRGNDVALLASHDAGVLVRLIAGDIDGHDGPGSTHTPMAMVHATLAPGARLEMPWPRDFNAIVYALSGHGTVGPEATRIATGRTAVLGSGDSIVAGADERQEGRHSGLELLILGGRPIGEPVAWAGPFVMNTHAELAQAFADFHSGKLGRIPAERTAT